MPVELHEVEASGYMFTVRAAGPSDGPLVLLLHGFPQTSRCFEHQLVALGDAGYRAVAPDQRGYSAGARPTEVEAYAVANLVDDVMALADLFGSDRFDLVGHDWGGMVAWTVAGQHPARVRTLASLSTPHPDALAAMILGGDEDQAARSSYLSTFAQPEVPERLLLGDDGSGDGLRRMFADSGLGAAQAEPYVAAMSEPGALTAALNWYRALGLGIPGDAADLTMPVLYIWSTEDVALGRKAAEATAEHVSGPYRFEVFEGVSHWIPDLAPDQVSSLLLEHLAAAD